MVPLQCHSFGVVLGAEERAFNHHDWNITEPIWCTLKEPDTRISKKRKLSATHLLRHLHPTFAAATMLSDATHTNIQQTNRRRPISFPVNSLNSALSFLRMSERT